MIRYASDLAMKGIRMRISGTTIEVEHGQPSEIILIAAKSWRLVVQWCGNHGIDHTSPNVVHVRSRYDAYKYRYFWYTSIISPGDSLTDEHVLAGDVFAHLQWRGVALPIPS
jgi:hypothetical protein